MPALVFKRVSSGMSIYSFRQLAVQYKLLVHESHNFLCDVWMKTPVVELKHITRLLLPAFLFVRDA
jgi:hypothetical protein